MLKDAKNEVIQKISSRCGFEIDEQKLSPNLRESINSAAEMMKQLSVIRNLLLVEKHDSERLVNRLRRRITGQQDKHLAQYMQQLSELHKTLDQRIVLLADEVYKELQKEWGEPKQQEGKRLLIEQLKCENCGAPLKVPSSLIAKCDYCGAVYELSDYLDMMGKNLNLPQETTKAETEAEQTGQETEKDA
ncbi:MAG: hypothetical protein QXV32_03940 [Conexivisphaerales archaeon]